MRFNKSSLPRPFLKWAGGKRQLLPELLAAVKAAGPFENYHEPFLGGGALFFALAEAGALAGQAYLSDVNRNLVDTYLGVRDEAEAVIDLLKAHQRLHEEAYFYEVRAGAPRKLAIRAARIIYLNKTCFNGLYRENSKGQFNVPFGRHKNPRICDEDNLRAVARTLKGVDIGVRDFTAVLDQAAPGDLVYFDPPYAPLSKTAFFTAYSRGGFDAAAQERLAEVAGTLAERGVKVILSNSMTDFTRQLYRDLHIHEVMARRRVNSRADRRGDIAEALVTSFPLELVPVERETPAVERREPPPASRRAVRSAPAPKRTKRTLVSDWLMENGYADVAELIMETEAAWLAAGKRTRRNWWEVLAGGDGGKPRKVAGRAFPVLRAAQLRQGLPVTPNALCHDPGESPAPGGVKGDTVNGD